jgi:1-aminocyclopropane-1-carboxylate synthase
VLIPAPYYPAFDNDLSVRNQIEPIPAHLEPGAPLGEQLDAAAAAAAAAGHPVRALLISNPSNPLGTVMPEGELREMMRWCLARRVHFVRCRGWGSGGGRGWCVHVGSGQRPA